MKVIIDQFSQHMRNASISHVCVTCVLSEHCCPVKTGLRKFNIEIFVKISQHILISAKREQNKGQLL
jgi:hypothetical protein